MQKQKHIKRNKATFIDCHKWFIFVFKGLKKIAPNKVKFTLQ